MFVSKTTGSPFINQPKDNSFNNTVLLLHGDGVVNANNTMFVDSSLANTYIPFNGTSSYFFDGSTAYLNLNGTPPALGTADFTIEFWAYMISGTTGVVYDQRTSTSTVAPLIYVFNSNWTYVATGSAAVITGSAVTLNAWTHVALVRISGVTRMYINGVQSGSSYTDTNSYTAPANRPYIGAYGDTAGGKFTGYISNLRVIAGTGLYTASFTPPTSELSILGNTLLLTAQSPTTAQSPSIPQPVFKDNSTYNFTLTTNGTPAISTGAPAIILGGGKPTQGTLSPFSKTGWSNYFNGSSDYLSATVPAPGSNFTVEGWVNFTTVGSGAGNSPTPFAILGSSSSTGFQVYGSALGWAVRNNTQNILGVGGSAGLGTPPVAGQWNHVAFVRDNGTVTLYVNGNSVGANSTAFTFSDTTFTIGNSLTGTSFMNGYVSNVRYINDVALYTSNFTVPTTQLTAVANTVLLTSQSNRFVDNSANNRSITITSTPSVQLFSPFAPSAAYSKNIVGGSVYFNGSSDFLTDKSTYSLPTTTTSFTFECWVYPQTQLNGTGIVCGDTTTATLLGLFGANPGSTALGANLWAVYYDLINDWVGVKSSTQLTLNQWSHIALSYNGTTATLYLNGVSIGTYTGAWTTAPFNSSGFYIGKRGDAGTAGTVIYYNGYISHVRLVEGTALYTSNFTPPTSPPTSISGTKILYNPTNAGIIDSTGKNNIATYGPATISSTQSKFGGTSLFFNGSSTYHTIPFRDYFNIPANTPVTFECWVYPVSYASAFIMANRNWAFGTSGPTWGFEIISSGAPRWSIAGTGSATYVLAVSTLTVPLNQWSHVAFTRDSSNVVRIFVNGIIGVSRTDGQAMTSASGDVFIGVASNLNGTSYTNGYLDDMRYTLGVARYTANFTPPTRKFEDR